MMIGNQTMTLRMIYKTETNTVIKHGKAQTRQAKAYRDYDWQEYRVKLYINGKHRKQADSHHDDKRDAINTANAMVYERKAKQ